MSRRDVIDEVLGTIDVVLREIADLPAPVQMGFAQELVRAVISVVLPRMPDSVTYQALVDQCHRHLLEVGPVPREELPR